MGATAYNISEESDIQLFPNYVDDQHDMDGWYQFSANGTKAWLRTITQDNECLLDARCAYSERRIIKIIIKRDLVSISPLTGNFTKFNQDYAYETVLATSAYEYLTLRATPSTGA